MKVLTISLDVKDDKIRVITEVEVKDSRREISLDFVDGIAEASDEVLKEVLGETALID